MALYGPFYAGTNKPVKNTRRFLPKSLPKNTAMLQAKASISKASTRKARSSCGNAARRLVHCRGVSKTRSTMKKCTKAGSNLIRCRWA